MADSLLADYILESTGYLSALSKTLPAIYPPQGKIQIYRLSILPIRENIKSTGYLSSPSKKKVYWLFILLGKLKIPL